jgi:heme/copper-type cytochrome/quinol oxidase subunit 2
MKLLILLVVVLGLVAAVQLSKVYQLSISLRGKREEEISEADNRMNGGLWLVFMVLFYASFIWLLIRYGDYLPPSASEHGLAVDQLMNFNMAIIFAVFFLVNTLLFWFSAKYYYRADRKATFYAHDNKLELIWTVIPSVVLAVIIAFGLKTWNEMTGEAADDAIRVELYSKQFDWTARYPGNDGEFGLVNYNLITPMNAMGIVTEEGVEGALAEIEVKILALEDEINFEKGHLLAEREELVEKLHEEEHGHDHGAHGAHADHHDGADAHGDDHADHADHDNHAQGGEGMKALMESRIAEIDHMLESNKVTILTEAAFEAKEDKLYRLQRHRQRILEIGEFNFDGELSAWDAGMDDQLVKGEFHLPIGREVEFVFRSRDVIHSAYMPHFRTQMNSVPGVPTRFKMTPIISTDSMRMILDDPDFNYILLCNKVCGAAHFNMQMKIVIESQEAYDAWLNEQDAFLVKEGEEGSETEKATNDVASENITASL